MQVIVEAHCTSGRSLRDAIATQKHLDKFGLQVSEHKRQKRPHGWMKVHSTTKGRYGAVNIEWDADTSTLVCRVVTRGTQQPSPIIGDLVGYLLQRHTKRIKLITIIR